MTGRTIQIWLSLADINLLPVVPSYLVEDKERMKHEKDEPTPLVAMQAMPQYLKT